WRSTAARFVPRLGDTRIATEREDKTRNVGQPVRGVSEKREMSRPPASHDLREKKECGERQGTTSRPAYWPVTVVACCSLIALALHRFPVSAPFRRLREDSAAYPGTPQRPGRGWGAPAT